MKAYTDNLETFMNITTQDQRHEFLTYCIKHKLVPNQVSFESFLRAILLNQKIQKVAFELQNPDRWPDVCNLIKLIIGLQEEVISFGDSEGIDTKTETVVKEAEKWIKENIEDEKHK